MAVSTQAPLQLMVPLAQLPRTQLPAEQSVPFAQILPQPPQLFASAITSTQPLPQTISPALHAQLPAAQV